MENTENRLDFYGGLTYKRRGAADEQIAQPNLEGALMADKKRLTLDFDPKAYEILSNLSADTGKTLAVVIRSAVALYALTHDEEKKDRRLAIVDADGKPLKEIVVT